MNHPDKLQRNKVFIDNIVILEGIGLSHLRYEGGEWLRSRRIAFSCITEC